MQIVGRYKFFKSKRLLKRKLKNYFIDNCKLDYAPKVEGFKLYDWGFNCAIRIGGVITSNKILIDELKEYFYAVHVEKLVYKGYLGLEVVWQEVEQLEYKPIKMDNTEILVGYDTKGLPITVNMLKCPHILITGLSGQGKTGLLKGIIKNLKYNNADIVLMNGFLDDFKGFNLRNIIDENKILSYLKNILDIPYRRTKPLYIFIEELSTIKNKKLISTIQELLCIARHYNIYIIGVIQIATKEELKFKSYFNTRITFKQLEESAYRVILNCSVSEQLKLREFYIFSDNLYKGKTYTV